MEVVQRMKEMQPNTMNATTSNECTTGIVTKLSDAEQGSYVKVVTTGDNAPPLRKIGFWKNKIYIRRQDSHHDLHCHHTSRRIGPPPRHRYAIADAPTRPVYTPGDDALPLNDDPHVASCDVMVLTFAARRHAEHLARLGDATPDIVDAIRADLDAIRADLDAIATLIATAADVGPRSRPAAQVDVAAPPGLFSPTRANTGQRGQMPSNVDEHMATDATSENRCNK